jgi:Raf kinase inhibitor-like YbhB/YbcL family protein
MMKLSTDAITDSGIFDSRYTCDSDNSSPELHWSMAPEGTQAFVLIFEDLDVSPSYIHWVVYRIPTNLQHLPAGIPPQDLLPNGIRQGVNSNRKLGYFGPCPPVGDTAHRYVFRLYALSEALDIPSRRTAQEVRDVISPYVLEMAELQGVYSRASAKVAKVHKVAKAG